MDGFKEHFETLAKESVNELFDEQYHKQVISEIEHITQLVSGKHIELVTPVELQTAMKSINTGKSPDYYNITIEHIKYSCDDNMMSNTNGILLHIVNSIFEDGKFPETLKVGIVSPIFKNKGHPNMATNYRASGRRKDRRGYSASPYLAPG